jgi:hypothetical protein
VTNCVLALLSKKSEFFSAGVLLGEQTVLWGELKERTCIRAIVVS